MSLSPRAIAVHGIGNYGSTQVAAQGLLSIEEAQLVGGISAPYQQMRRRKLPRDDADLIELLPIIISVIVQ